MKKLHYKQLIISVLLGSAAIAFECLAQATTPNEKIRANTTPLLIAQQSNFTSFFEEGRLQSENRLNLRRSPGPAIPVSSDSKFWQPVIFQAGGCSFWIPPGILTEETVVLNTTVGKLNFRTLASNSDNARYVVAYVDQLAESQVKDARLLLQAVRDRVAPPDKYQLKSDLPITLNTKYPGRELTFQGKNDAIALRAYLVDRRVYVLGVKQSGSNPSAKQVSGFLNSFQLLGS